MAKLININDALEKLCEFCSCGDYEDCDYRCSEFENISNIPTVDAVEVVHGRWVTRKSWHFFVCSECSYESVNHSNYCPNCGAKMDL